MFQSEIELPKWFSKARELAKKAWGRNPSFYKSAIYLTDPSANREIDRYIEAVIWPAMVKAVKSTHFRIFDSEKPKIGQEWHVRACRSVSIVVEDPKQPNTPETWPPWYFRLEAQCHEHNSASLRWYFSADLPQNSDWQMLQDLLHETSGFSLPTQLTVRASPVKYFHVLFEGGGSGNRELSIEERIEGKIKGFCDFAETVNELQTDCRNRLLFRKLIKEASHIIET